MEKYFIKVEEQSIKSKEAKAINSYKKEQEAKRVKMSTDEGKAEALAFIFGTK